MRLAIIDLGTNSVRFDVVEAHPQAGEPQKLHRDKLMIRLGEGVFLKKRLNTHSIQVCIEAFKGFKKTLEEFKVDRIVAFGTSALREAKDSDKLIRKIKRETGISVRIISGEEEARLIAKGVIANEFSLNGRYALVDIGGGSTEISICSGRKVLHSSSFPLGTARLQQVFLKSIPPELNSKRGHPVEQMRRHIRGVLLYHVVTQEWPSVKRIIGSSGTIRILQKISKKISDHNFIDSSTLDNLVEKMIPLNRSQLLRIPGMEARRVDMILAGALLLQECMNALHAQHIYTTEFSLRDGILAEELEFQKDKLKVTSKNLVSLVFKHIERFGGSTEELRQSVRTSEVLFDRLKKVHGLSVDWKAYLTSAALLHASGKFISPIVHEAHSAYIARHLDIPHLEDWQRRFLSQLCLEQSGGKILKKDLPFKKNKRLQKNFLKVLAILRLVVAFSFQRERPVVIDSVKVKGRSVKLHVSKRYSPDLQILRAEQQKQFFEDVFHHELMIEGIE